MPTGTETVLLVEDEESVRKWVGQVLVQLGYSVVEASNGEEAFRLATAPAARSTC